MFKKKKTNQTETTETTVTPETVKDAPAAESAEQADKPQEFQKNIKTLWIYTSLFCIFALVLIFISSFFQEKYDKDKEDLQIQLEKHELELSDKQSTIKNIETEIEGYKKLNQKLEEDNKKYQEQYAIDKDLLLSSSEIIANADYLLLTQQALDTGDKETARTHLACVDVNYLTDAMLTAYNNCATELAAG